jgi:hypothetical protein
MAQFFACAWDAALGLAWVRGVGFMRPGHVLHEASGAKTVT